MRVVNETEHSQVVSSKGDSSDAQGIQDYQHIDAALLRCKTLIS